MGRSTSQGLHGDRYHQPGDELQAGKDFTGDAAIARFGLCSDSASRRYHNSSAGCPRNSSRTESKSARGKVTIHSNCSFNAADTGGERLMV